MKLLASLLIALSFTAIGCADVPTEEDPEYGSGEGVDFDEDNPNVPLDDGKSDLPRYAVPTDLPALVAPEIIVSLDGLTVHLFDRATGFQAVYPAGVGTKTAGKSITPTGHFATGPNNADAWWYVNRRTVPDYFGGFPFLRLTARNTVGANTYALHGPITPDLIRGYVSHGCVRMASNDIIRLFWMVKPHESIPVTIQREVERDAAGARVDVGKVPALWAPGAAISFGASVGPRR
ncbi:MAG: L,D-transpeptidase [Myxococcota bacterium]|nr:L,D-transpeptidase [Myxococcota bacterium]